MKCTGPFNILTLSLHFRLCNLYTHYDLYLSVFKATGCNQRHSPCLCSVTYLNEQCLIPFIICLIGYRTLVAEAIDYHVLLIVKLI